MGGGGREDGRRGKRGGEERMRRGWKGVIRLMEIRSGGWSGALHVQQRTKAERNNGDRNMSTYHICTDLNVYTVPDMSVTDKSVVGGTKVTLIALHRNYIHHFAKE